MKQTRHVMEHTELSLCFVQVLADSSSSTNVILLRLSESRDLPNTPPPPPDLLSPFSLSLPLPVGNLTD